MSHSVVAPIAEAILGLLWKPRVLRLLSSRKPVVLIYHSIAPGPGEYFGADVFERHICSLKSRFRLVSAQEHRRARHGTEDIEVILTLDDGFLNNAQHAVPVLRHQQVPAVFFVSTRHCRSGRFLWFAYLRALSRWFREKELVLDDVTYDLSASARGRSLRKLREHLLSLRPHPQAMYDKIERSLPSLQTFVPQPHLDDHYAGMTWDHIRDIARDPLFEIGVHTVDHPFLTICDESEMERQVRVNRDELERMAGKPIRSIAYPSGDYDTTVAARCADSGMEVRYAVETRRGSGGVPLDDSCIPRIGVYRSSMNIVGFKVQWGNLLRRTPLKFG